MARQTSASANELNFSPAYHLCDSITLLVHQKLKRPTKAGQLHGPAEDPATEHDLATLTNVTGPMRITWTCQLQAAPAPDAEFGIQAIGANGGAGFGLRCEQDNCTVGNVTCTDTTMSGVWTPDPANLGGAPDWLVYAGCQTGFTCDPLAAWAATVELWY
jgi:hypothetical protein